MAYQPVARDEGPLGSTIGRDIRVSFRLCGFVVSDPTTATLPDIPSAAIDEICDD